MKRATAERKKMEAYNRIDATRPHVCTGCGRGDVPVTHSHLIPQQRLVRMDPALIADPQLITFHCHRCHERFENHDPALEDYRENLEIIERYDPEQARYIKGLNAEI
jgi:5-methylcytosine-specific restriction endonuclease McrA